jgi:hypothetical protein
MNRGRDDHEVESNDSRAQSSGSENIPQREYMEKKRMSRDEILKKSRFFQGIKNHLGRKRCDSPTLKTISHSNFD